MVDHACLNISLDAIGMNMAYYNKNMNSFFLTSPDLPYLCEVY
jgi:hypothetical protein